MAVLLLLVNGTVDLRTLRRLSPVILRFGRGRSCTRLIWIFTMPGTSESRVSADSGDSLENK